MQKEMQVWNDSAYLALVRHLSGIFGRKYLIDGFREIQCLVGQLWRQLAVRDWRNLAFQATLQIKHKFTIGMVGWGWRGTRYITIFNCSLNHNNRHTVTTGPERYVLPWISRKLEAVIYMFRVIWELRILSGASVTLQTNFRAIRWFSDQSRSFETSWNVVKRVTA